MGASTGLGFLLLDGQMTSRPQVIIGSLVLFAILGKLTDVVLVAVGDRFVGWQDTFKSPAREADDAAD
jgi:sulfonate transport system permease protein